MPKNEFFLQKIAKISSFWGLCPLTFGLRRALPPDPRISPPSPHWKFLATHLSSSVFVCFFKSQCPHSLHTLIDPSRKNRWICKPDVRDSETEKITILFRWITMKMMTCQMRSTNAKYFEKYINISICLFINFAYYNLFVVMYVTRLHFLSCLINQKSLFLLSPNISRCAKGLFHFIIYLSQCGKVEDKISK